MRSWEDYKTTMRSEDALFALARSGDLESIRQLNPSFERINSVDVKGYSPLMLAAYNGNVDVAEWLLNRGANPDGADLGGNSILMGAAFKGYLAIVKLLIARGADPQAKNAKGQTARDFANLFGRREVSEYLAKLDGEAPTSVRIQDVLKSWSHFIFGSTVYRQKLNSGGSK